MARRNRGRIPAGTYHVWRRSAGPIEMFRDDTDRTAFCNRLASSIAKYQLLCHAFVKLRSVTDDADLLGNVRYIARNPVRAGFCQRPEEWYWGSYRGSAGYAQPFFFVDDSLAVGQLATRRAEAQRLLRIFVEPAE
jgi:hypothetical protein